MWVNFGMVNRRPQHQISPIAARCNVSPLLDKNPLHRPLSSLNTGICPVGNLAGNESHNEAESTRSVQLPPKTAKGSERQ